MIAPALSLFWLAVLVFVAAPAAGLAYAAVRGIELWRALKSFLRALGEATADLGERAERLAAYEGPDVDRAAEAFARAQRSRAQLRVLTNAFGRAREQLLGPAALFPKK
jgi:hypothetical protein